MAHIAESVQRQLLQYSVLKSMPAFSMPIIALACAIAQLGVSTQALAGQSAAGQTSSQDDPRAWVARMNEALATRNYDGVFVHELAGNRTTLRIIHRVKDGTMSERLVSTDGSGREFIRNGRQWVAYFPDRKLVVVEQRRRGGFISGLRGLGTEAEQHYDIRGVERGRLQGRATRLITVIPKDQFRYGYRFWIDEKTSMPVKTQLATADGRVIEEISFVSLNLPNQIDDDLLKPDTDASNFKWLRRDEHREAEVKPAQWLAEDSRLPPGFRLGAPRGKNEKRIESARMLVTDGLAWVSVFIESANESPQLSRTGVPRKAEGPVQLGASAAYTARHDAIRVTAVGEVPPATVKAIAESIRPR